MLQPSFAIPCGSVPLPSPGAGACQRLQESWPQDALRAFSLRMANHGLSVSATLMRGDPGYAVEQLRQADEVADEPLRELARGLLRSIESRCPELRCAG